MAVRPRVTRPGNSRSSSGSSLAFRPKHALMWVAGARCARGNHRRCDDGDEEEEQGAGCEEGGEEARRSRGRQGRRAEERGAQDREVEGRQADLHHHTGDRESQGEAAGRGRQEGRQARSVARRLLQGGGSACAGSFPSLCAGLLDWHWITAKATWKPAAAFARCWGTRTQWRDPSRQSWRTILARGYALDWRRHKIWQPGSSALSSHKR